MKIGFGCDHAAVELKDALLEHLKEQGYECVDYGAYSPEDKVDYPVQGQKVAEAIVSGEIDSCLLYTSQEGCAGIRGSGQPAVPDRRPDQPDGYGNAGDPGRNSEQIKKKTAKASEEENLNRRL